MPCQPCDQGGQDEKELQDVRFPDRVPESYPFQCTLGFDQHCVPLTPVMWHVQTMDTIVIAFERVKVLTRIRHRRTRTTPTRITKGSKVINMHEQGVHSRPETAPWPSYQYHDTNDSWSVVTDFVGSRAPGALGVPSCRSTMSGWLVILSPLGGHRKVSVALLHYVVNWIRSVHCK